MSLSRTAAGAPLLLLALVLSAACSRGAEVEADSTKRCYGKQEGDTETLVVLELDTPLGPVLEVRTLREGEDTEPPLRTLGSLPEPGVFAYADGSRLAFDEQALRGPEKGLLAGLVLPARPCP